MDFHGVKVALTHEGKLLLHLRDDKPGLFNANMWDFAGGGREGDETPEECAVREVKEELAIKLTPESFVWRKEYPAQKDPAQKAWFMVAEISPKDIESVVLGEGQTWKLMDQEEFFKRSDVIEALKGRYQDYLDGK